MHSYRAQSAELAYIVSQYGGFHWRKYSEYRRNIRDEYNLIPDDVFYRGRKQILEELLQHSSLYHTEYGKTNWEAQARDNLSREISELETALDEK